MSGASAIGAGARAQTSQAHGNDPADAQPAAAPATLSAPTDVPSAAQKTTQQAPSQPIDPAKFGQPENLQARQASQRPESGAFVCAGGGHYGAVAGVCVDTNKQVYVYGGAGTPGPSVCVGVTPKNNPGDYLSGWAGQVTQGPGAGYSPNGGKPVVAGLACSKGASASVTYGVNLNETVREVKKSGEQFAGKVDRAIRDLYNIPYVGKPMR